MAEKEINGDLEVTDEPEVTETPVTDLNTNQSSPQLSSSAYYNDRDILMSPRPAMIDDRGQDTLWSIPWSSLMMVLFAILFMLIGLQPSDESMEASSQLEHVLGDKTFTPKNISTDNPPVPALVKKIPEIKTKTVASSITEKATSSQTVHSQEPEISQPQANLITLTKIRESITEKNSRQIMATLTNNNSIKINLAGSLLFEHGQSTLSEAGKLSLNQLIQPLSETPYQINVVGHTDDANIDTTRYEDKWDLSLRRASAVARFLIQTEEIEAHKLTIMGRAQYDPVAANLTAESRALNRRVEIIITQKYYRPLEDRL